MQAESFFRELGADFYTGVPDSQLKALCDFLLDNYGTDPAHHIIAANEGNAVGIAAGYHMATGRVPVVYMQNSGEGNVINPVASLLNEEVYGIPCIFVIGWRGEPGVHDEPQHIYQGKITCELLELMDISYRILTNDTTENDLRGWLEAFSAELYAGKSVAIVVRKGALTYDGSCAGGAQVLSRYEGMRTGREKSMNGNDDPRVGSDGESVLNCDSRTEERSDLYFPEPLNGQGNHPTREQIIEKIVGFTGDDPIVSTTGKASRELFEIRERNNAGDDMCETAGSDLEKTMEEASAETVHQRDFLTVGSMGHCSSIALGIALQKPDKRLWCIDGDGAALMHMGSMAVICDASPKNLVHIVINNGVHETVGGQPVATRNINLKKLAVCIGYANSYRAESLEELSDILAEITGKVKMAGGEGKGNRGNQDQSQIINGGPQDGPEGPLFIEIMSEPGAREDLGRPTTSARENKDAFMRFLGYH